MDDDIDQKKGKLSVVATPIGNLGDMTFRGLWNLKECDVIYAEDTRVISKLLAHYGLRTSVQRLDAATETKKAREIIERLESGQHICLVSDAGTPAISDPGSRLISLIRANGRITIEAIPGPSALTAALSIAGLDTTSFTFFGFLPQKKGRQTMLKKITNSEFPVILFESPHRIYKLLAELAAHNIREVRIDRELTKVHEEMLAGEPLDVAKDLRKRKAERGEFVVIVIR